MKEYGYYDGVFGSLSELSVPLTDRSIFFGDGVYDAAIGGGGEVFLLEEHIHRLLENAKALSFPDVPSEEELSGVIREVILRSGLDFYFVYIQLSRALSPRTHSARGASGRHLLVTVTPYTLPSPESRLKVILREDLRYQYCNIKTVNLLPNVLYSTEADALGADEAILHRGDTVTECAHSNISILKGGVLYTHPCDRHILPGITRRHLLFACESLGIPYHERAFGTEELFLADEVLITSTSKLLLAVDEIDGIRVGGRDPIQKARLSLTLFGEFFSFLKKCRKI